MKTFFKQSQIVTVALLLSASVMSSACAQQSGAERQKKGPPAEAFSICEGKTSGSSCSLETPRGTMTGVCIDYRDEGQLVCAPEGGKRERTSR